MKRARVYCNYLSCTTGIALIMITSNIFGNAFTNPDQLALAKPGKYSKVLSFSLHKGAMLGNGTDSQYPVAVKAYYTGLDVRLGFALNDQSEIYNQLYRLPVTGIGWYSASFNNNTIGKPSAIYYFFNFPLSFEQSRKITMSYLGSFGISYNLNPYDAISNPYEIYIGSSVNCYVKFGLIMNYHITPTWTTSLALEYRHFSNGAFKLPNKGINVIPVSLSVSYRPNPVNPYAGEKSSFHFIRHNQFNIEMSGGTKNYTIGGSNYFKAAIGLNWLRALNYKYKAGFGLNMFYTERADIPDIQGSDISSPFSYAVTGCWEWSINKHLYVPLAFGVYLKRSKANGERDPFYERVGIRYRFNNKMFAGITIKAHKGSADFFEWTLGYTLCHDPNIH